MDVALRVYVRVNTEVRRGREGWDEAYLIRHSHDHCTRHEQACTHPGIARAEARTETFGVGKGRDERDFGSKSPPVFSHGTGFCRGQRTCVPASYCPLCANFELGGHAAGRVRGRCCCLRTECCRCIVSLAMSMDGVVGTCALA